MCIIELDGPCTESDQSTKDKNNSLKVLKTPSNIPEESLKRDQREENLQILAIVLDTPYNELTLHGVSTKDLQSIIDALMNKVPVE